MALKASLCPHCGSTKGFTEVHSGLHWMKKPLKVQEFILFTCNTCNKNFEVKGQWRAPKSNER